MTEDTYGPWLRLTWTEAYYLRDMLQDRHAHYTARNLKRMEQLVQALIDQLEKVLEEAPK